MTFNDIVLELEKYRAAHPEQRTGQAYFNRLYELEPELANEIRATGLDPFYRDDILPDFLTKVYEEIETRP